MVRHGGLRVRPGSDPSHSHFRLTPGGRARLVVAFMSTKPSRRTMLKSAGAAALAILRRRRLLGRRRPDPSPFRRQGHGEDHLEAGLGGPPAAGVSADEAVAAAARRIRSWGSSTSSPGVDRFWEEPRLKEMMTVTRHGLTVKSDDRRLPNAIWQQAREGRRHRKVLQSIVPRATSGCRSSNTTARTAGGLLRGAGRAGAGWTA
jgi:hypothetical protein